MRRLLASPAALALAAILLFPATALAASTADLVKLLGASSPKVRVQAAGLLGKGGDPAAVGPLCTAVTGDDSEAVRAMSATALGMIGHESARRALTEASSTDPSRLVKDAASKSLAMLGKTAPVAPTGDGATIAMDTLGGTVQGPLGDTFRTALATELGKLGFQVLVSRNSDAALRAELGGLRRRAFALKPSILGLTVTPAGGKTIFECKVSGIAVEPSGRMEAMSEASAKLTVGAESLSEAQRADFSARAVAAAAKSLATELKSRL